MPLKLHNSLSDQLEPFEPLIPGRASLYVCGPTVYHDSHLGHAKTYVSFDVILRWLRYRGLRTFSVQNITDVGHLVGDADEGDDKILKRARELDQEPMAVVETYMRRHFDAMDQLGVVRPDISPRATGHIPEQLEAIDEMIRRGDAYEANGSVYFSVSKDPRYGELSNRIAEQQQEGGRIESRGEKRDPRDFALWKRAESGHLMRWRDPFSGWGYPGWHTECVVMSTRYLGDGFDIHGGGMELKFPHHDCEITQARSLGKPFARYWLHNNMLTIEGQKMSKSTGNFVTLHDAFRQHDPLTVRYFIVSGHYRSVVDYSESALQAGRQALRRLHQTVRALKERLPRELLEPAPEQHFADFRTRFEAAMDDDFGTPQALAVLFDLSHEVNTALPQNPSAEVVLEAWSLFHQLGGDVLGIIPEQLEEQSGAALDGVMNLVIDLRNDFRQQKDYAHSDLIRDRLKECGIALKDSRGGTTWEPEH